MNIGPIQVIITHIPKTWVVFLKKYPRFIVMCSSYVYNIDSHINKGGTLAIRGVDYYGSK